MNITQRIKTLHMVRLLLSLCVCASTMTQALDKPAIVANAMLAAQTRVDNIPHMQPVAAATGTTTQPVVQHHHHYPALQTPAIQPSVVDKSFYSSVGNFICDHPKLILAVAAATASTISIAIGAWKTGALERLVRRNHTDVTGRLDTLQGTATQTADAVTALRTTVGTNHTAVMGNLDDVNRTVTSIQNEAREARVEATTQYRGFASTLFRQDEQLTSLTTNVEEGFKTLTANQQRSDEANQAMRSQMGTLGEEQRTSAQKTSVSFAELFLKQKQEAELAAQRAAQSQLWKNSLEKQVQDIAGNNVQARQTLEGILTRTGELESTVSSIKQSQQAQGQQLSTMGEQLTNQSRQLNQVLAGQEKTNANMARLNHSARTLANMMKTPMLETLVTRARTRNKGRHHKPRTLVITNQSRS